MTTTDPTTTPATLAGSSPASEPEVRHTACTLDCPDACSLAVTVADGRITRVDAGPANPFTAGWICAKVRQHARRVYSPDRVLTPLVRTGPKGTAQFREATWDEALELIGDRMQEAISAAGPASIVGFTYNSSAAAIEKASLTDAVLAALGTTSAAHTICAATASAAWGSVFGAMASADPTDVVHSKLIVIWGANPTVSNTHFPPLVTRAVAAGATLVVIDPRRTAMARRAHHHLAVRPGTDVVLALAIANRWAEQGRINRVFVDSHATGADELLAAAAEWPVERAAEVCGIEAAAIEALADAWAATPATMLRLGWGQERNANGGASSRAVLALAVLAGSFGPPGAGVIYATGAPDVRPQRRWPEAARRAARSPDRPEVPMHQIGRWLAPDAGTPYRVLFVQGANPAVMCPDTAAVDRALARDDVFTVVHDQVLTDTARFADVVLPATTSFEIDDVNVSYGSLSVEPVRAVIGRVGESRSNDEVGLALAHTLGLTDEGGQPWAAAPVTDAVADPGPRLAPSPRQFVESFPPDNRARLIDTTQGAPRYEPLAAAGHEAPPLTLISPASDKLVNSMFGEFQSPAAELLVHPADAGPRGLETGQPALIRNGQGELAVTVRVSDEVRPGVVSIPKGIWRRSFTPNGEASGATIHPAGLNLLTPDTGDPLVNGACFNDTRVELVGA